MNATNRKLYRNILHVLGSARFLKLFWDAGYMYYTVLPNEYTVTLTLYRSFNVNTTQKSRLLLRNAIFDMFPWTMTVIWSEDCPGSESTIYGHTTYEDTILCTL